ncbi:MAG: tetratricopeptide repeat protein, partial [Roseiflexaceae bacterium]|nr:tetratricopeptide repeat protein [Roseiflexaceae bacterium]
MEDIDTLVYQGALAAAEGRSDEAQALLMRAIELDEQNELAWLWLSGAVSDPGDQQIALENVLA